LHLACKHGHSELVKLLLEWKADVRFKSPNGKNALDIALDFAHKECVLVLIKDLNWKLSLQNANYDKITGKVDTPMRNLIRKMPDLAEMVLDKCISDNGKRPVADDYAITLFYEYLDDAYSCKEWVSSDSIGKSNTDAVCPVEDNSYQAYGDDDRLLESAVPYNKSKNILKENHPLKIMVSSKCRQLLVHPVITGLLNSKWNQFGKYIYYSNLLVYVVFLTILNIYALMLPRFYTIDWIKLSAERQSFTYNFKSKPSAHSPKCLFLHQNADRSCWILNEKVSHLRLVIFFFAAIKLSFEAVFFVVNIQRIKLSKITFIILYVFSLLLTINFSNYQLKDNLLKEFKIFNKSKIDFFALRNLQKDTGIRQEWQEKIAAFCVFLSWINLLMMLQKISLIPNLGVFVIMFTNTLKTFLRFLVILIFFIVGFALSFHILAGNQYVFGSLYESIITVFVMMVGEMDYAGRFYNSDVSYHNQMFTRDASYVMFFTFVTVMTIIIMNLLVGLAVGDIMQVREDATIQRVGLQIRSTLDMEFYLPSFLRKRFNRRRETIYNAEKNKSCFSSLFDICKKGTIFKTLQKYQLSPEDDDEQEKVENVSEMDKIFSILSNLRLKLDDVKDEQNNQNFKLQKLSKLLKETQEEANQNSQILRSDLSNTRTDIRTKIEDTHIEVKDTKTEVTGTHGAVSTTKDLVIYLKGVSRAQEERLHKVEEGLIEKIVKSKTELYEKIKFLQNTEEEIGESINKVKDDIYNQCISWNQMGEELINQTKKIEEGLKMRDSSELFKYIEENNRNWFAKWNELQNELIQLKIAVLQNQLATNV